MPAPLGTVNRAGVPVRVLILQAAGGTVFSLLFLLVPSVSTSYWILSALTAQVIIVMYVLIFAAAFRLRHTRPEVPRPFRVPLYPVVPLIFVVGTAAGLAAIVWGEWQDGHYSPIAGLGIAAAGFPVYALYKKLAVHRA